jgi:hypothetical protein
MTNAGSDWGQIPQQISQCRKQFRRGFPQAVFLGLPKELLLGPVVDDENLFK